MNIRVKQAGFTLIELLLVISIVGILFGLTTIGLLKAQQSTAVGTSEEMFIADLKSQQAKAMNGADGGGSFSVHFESNTYILFNGDTYILDDPKNLSVSVDENISFSGYDIVFLPVSGEVKDYLDTAPPIITITNATGSEQKTIQLNKYGVVIQD